MFAPFIFIEDPLDLNSTLPPSLDGAPSRRGSTFASPNGNVGTGTGLLKSNRIDPYYLIIRVSIVINSQVIPSEHPRQNELHPLRVDVEGVMSLDNPYTFRGPTDDASYEGTHGRFLRARSADLNLETSSVTPAFFNISSPMLPTGSVNDDTVPTYHGCVVRLVKFGILNRKEDTVEGGKRAIARKWKGWGVIMTHSHLLFYRDMAQVGNIRRKFEESVDLPPPLIGLTRPDEVWPLKNSVAILDKSYIKVPWRSARILSALTDGHRGTMLSGLSWLTVANRSFKPSQRGRNTNGWRA